MFDPKTMVRGTSPYRLGRIAYRTPGGLKGMPYGPGPRQEAFLKGFHNEAEEAHARRQR